MSTIAYNNDVTAHRRSGGGNRFKLEPSGSYEPSEEAEHSMDRAREILEGMRQKRVSLEETTGHASLNQSHDHSKGSSSCSTLWTVDEHAETTEIANTVKENETDRARDILELMRKRRESFSKLLVASPTSTKHSLSRTESTAAISWVSSSSQASTDHEVAFIYSDEEASNSYDDYAYHPSDGDSLSFADTTLATESVLTMYTGGYDSASVSSRSLLSDLSFQNTVLRTLEDIRNYDAQFTSVPSALAALPIIKNGEASFPEAREVLERKTPGTSRARGLYHQTSNRKLKSYQYLKSENTGHGTETSRLRADLAAISERRTMLANMLDSVQELKSQDIDFSVVASTILSATSMDPSQINDESFAEACKPMDRLAIANAAHASSKRETKHTAPVEFVDFGNGKRWSADDAREEEQVESFGFPLSDVRWAGSDDHSASFRSSSSEDDIEWDKGEKLEQLFKEDSVRGSLYFSEASSTDVSDEAALPLQIEFKVKTTPLEEAATEPPQALRSAEFLKALYSPRPEEAIQTVQESKYGGIYQIAQRTQDVERFTDRSLSHLTERLRRSLPDDDDFMNIPYNVEDRFAGGLYYIASQTRPSPNRAMI